MKIIVMGHGGHGKGEVCKMIQELTGLVPVSSSWAAKEYVWHRLLDYGIIYESPDEAYDNRRYRS